MKVFQAERDDYESKFDVFRKRSSEYHNEVNSNQHVKRKKIEILNSKESDDNQASIDNCSILNTGNNSDTNKADLKPLKKTEKFIIESKTGQVLSELDTEVNFKEEIESQPDKNAATGAVPQEICGQAMQNFPGEQMEILDTLTSDCSESKLMTHESLSGRDDYESKFDVFRKKSSEYHNELNSNQHVKRKKIEILNKVNFKEEIESQPDKNAATGAVPQEICGQAMQNFPGEQMEILDTLTSDCSESKLMTHESLSGRDDYEKVNFKEEIESQPDKNAATGAVPQEICGQAMQNFPGEQMEILDTLTSDCSESKLMTHESLSGRDDYESKFDVFRKRSSEYHNEVNSNQHVKRKKIEILNSKESDDNQASIDNCSILNTGNNSDTNKADLKPLKKTEKFIIESETGQVLSEFPSNTIFAKPDGKNTLLKIQILNGTIYLDSGRKSICENAPVLKITETRLMNCDSSNSSPIRHDHALHTKNNTNFSVNVSVLENKRDENENISGMFKMKHQKNAPDVLMEKDLSLDHLFGANVKTHFDHKCRNENLIQHKMQNVEGNKDSNTVDFDCNRQCYKQVYQEMRKPNDLQNIMHNKSKKREIRKFDTKNIHLKMKKQWHVQNETSKECSRCINGEGFVSRPSFGAM
ncbi:hypothetical protein CEXT_347511 [Caerostris extrusa]|uniref:Uncharacterized protein n=1 Tax=Caerostris extrusa TaxID=172846 RepID=A0AAV4UW91_CAEEX|nr:hypothetical protein CEXT_347511 [Caerostris extrusa]